MYTDTHLYCSASLRAIEAQHHAAQPSLMERAGAAAADYASQLLAHHEGEVLVLAGPGNNGGDGFVLARRLLQAGHSVQLCFADADAGAAQPADAAQARAAWLREGGRCLSEIPLRPWALAVDALFGIGLRRPAQGRHAEWIAAFNALPCTRLALDVPSGLLADTGATLGPCVRAHHCLSFIGLKPGLFTLEGPDHAGTIALATLGLTATPAANDGHLLEPKRFAPLLQPRRRNSHKGSYGQAAVIGGATGMLGAALLAARAALLLGAGKVFVGALDSAAPPCDVQFPELMLRSPTAAQHAASALLVGPGLGQGADARQALEQALDFAGPLLLDADALNLLAAESGLQQRLQQRSGANLLTPHPAEAARLLGCTLEAVQAQRIASALMLAQRFRAQVVLKGCGSVVASPAGSWAINPSGNPGLASAGSGDVLAGIVLALLAQHWPADMALAAAVHLHGLAAEALAATGQGPIGLCASELGPAARRLFNQWCNGASAAS